MSVCIIQNTLFIQRCVSVNTQQTETSLKAGGMQNSPLSHANKIASFLVYCFTYFIFHYILQKLHFPENITAQKKKEINPVFSGGEWFKK